eukprot:13800815-Alexandrium_andersonii.AAC.1
MCIRDRPGEDRAGQFDLSVIARPGQVGIPIARDQPWARPVRQTREKAERGWAGASRDMDRGKAQRATFFIDQPSGCK